MIWTGCNQGGHHDSGAGYGLQIKFADRDTYFSRAWTRVAIELPSDAGPRQVQANVAKPSF